MYVSMFSRTAVVRVRLIEKPFPSDLSRETSRYSSVTMGTVDMRISYVALSVVLTNDST
jgi:hypothetical protein